MSHVAQYTCPIHDTRVNPFSTFEHLTVAPEPGAMGGEVLLRSLNAKRRVQGQSPLAWCFACAKEGVGEPLPGWVEAVAEYRPNLEARYLSRSGIRHRLTAAGRRARLRELRGQMQLIQSGAE